MNTTSAPMPRSASTSLVWPIVLIPIGILALALPVATSFGVARVMSWLHCGGLYQTPIAA